MSLRYQRPWERSAGSRKLNTPAKLRAHFTPKPYEYWAACPRCGFRVAYSELRREKLTGLLMCRSCWDPWHPMLDFQAKADRSIEPPSEPYPVRWGIGGPQDPWNAGYNQAAPPPDEVRQRQASMTMSTNSTPPGVAYGAFPSPPLGPGTLLGAVQFPFSRANPPLADAPIGIGYDGVFVPSGSQVTSQAPTTPYDPYAGASETIQTVRTDTPGETGK